MQAVATPSVPLDSFGAEWVGVDLHLHTPGVETFRLPESGDWNSVGGRSRFAAMYADALARAGIRIAGITDYNGIRTDWYAALRKEAKPRGITILPGAELSLSAGKSGLHVLAIFDEAADAEEINRFINSLDRDPARLLFEGRKTRDISPRDNAGQLLLEVRDRFNCLLIFPHPASDSGICKSLQLKDAADLVLQTRPDAIEHCSPSALESLRSTQVLPTGYLERLAQVEFSDPKALEEIGTKLVDGRPRKTWLKLSAFDIEAIRLAMHDPAVRVRTVSPPAHGYSRVLGMVIEGSGFLGNLKMPLSPDLTTLIGGRGVGKSALIETLRYGLGLDPFSDDVYREGLVKHALGSGGRVSVFVDRFVEGKKGETYRVDRVFGERPRVTEISGRSVDVRASELLGPGATPAVFGQREIYAVAMSDEYRLRLLDELIGDAADAAERQLADSLESLDRNARELLDLSRKLARRAEFEQRLRTLDNEIAIYEKLGVAEKLRAATDVRNQGQLLRRFTSAVEAAGTRATGAKDALLAQIDSVVRATIPAGPATNLVNDAMTLVRAFRADVISSTDALVAAAARAVRELTRLEKEFEGLAAPIDQEVAAVKRQLQSETVDPDRLIALSQERNSIKPLLEELDRVDSEIELLRKQRHLLLEKLRERRLETHRIRREAAERINRQLGGTVRIEVVFKGQKSDFAQRVGSRLRGSGVTADAIERLTAPEATDGASLAEHVREGAEALRRHHQVTAGMADKVVSWLTVEESRLFQLETEQARDSVTVALRVAPEEYRSLERLSVGQRSTAILLLLLAQVDRALILDQPEDDLDNRFIYEDIVQILRSQKSQRQVIVATHNANIPVLGDAELILPLEVRDGRASLQGAASLDDRTIRELVKQVMEGGEEAFRRRAEKYGTAI
ncbi:MAG: chromosome segregation protein SMC [Chloroflexi bacterium]|nr:chromosome segregation protein SMC [Chloroflexota bacterium]